MSTAIAPGLPLKVKWTDYIPVLPQPKQLAFLMLPHREAFFGGAAGGGKSWALLMAALQWVDIPGYSALLIRKTFSQLSQPGALISDSHLWLDETDAKWNNSLHQWRFPSGATLSFGYMDSYFDRFRYQGAAWQFIGVDEAVQLEESAYRYLASRIRKPVCPLHHKKGFDPECRTCKSVYALSKVPTRLRAASNPPALGQGEWVKERFRVKEVDGIYRGTHPTRAFIPSLLTDNQGLDQEDYAARLEELDPVTRAQLLKGDWSIKTEGRFKPSWFKGRTWSRSTQDTWLVGSEGLTRRSSHPEDPDYLTGRFVGLNAAVKRDSNRKFPEVYHTGELFFFIMTDPAATQKEGPGDADIWLRKAPAWTAFGCFALTPRNDLLILDFVRFQKEIPDVIRGLHGFVRRCVRKGRTPQFIGVEANGVGKGVFQQLQRDGLPVIDCTRHTHDKFIYATPAMNRAAYGQIYLPAPDMPDCEWMEAFQSELFSYVGHPNLDVCDQIDVLAHACQFAHTRAVMSEQQQPATGDLDDMIGVF